MLQCTTIEKWSHAPQTLSPRLNITVQFHDAIEYFKYGQEKVKQTSKLFGFTGRDSVLCVCRKNAIQKKQHRDKITLHSLPVLYIYTQNIHYWISINLYPGYYYRYYSTWYEYGTMNNVSPQNTPFTWKLVYEIVIQVILLKEISLLPTAC